MSNLFDVEAELSDFNLDRMHPSGKANLIKVAGLIGVLDTAAWMSYIDNGSLDLNAIAKELKIARSSLYQNEHIKSYIILKAKALKVQGYILELPYQSRDKLTKNNSNINYFNSVKRDEVIKVENAEIKSLQLQVSELSAKIDNLKTELRTAKNQLAKVDVRSDYLTRFGRFIR
ncbi:MULTISPECIES: hypothetical protein [Alteromonadales]|jgi:hypothetical protein|uniref:hypothetical protein n=1 Tax=Alteromonadales TaxID=135622 RepID=UPI00119625FB|nr:MULTISPECIES: hypothetical protein [Alteromonadales]MBA6414547.1 hypothetical protein [Colwellia sp. 6M3]MBB1350360.1 hypothetical protein [Pseudoalteromonas sp. SG45-3]MBB1357467.1 hypothetical protein [Pseudoalteromonas sp. SG45-6]TVU71510.1 hypothetical protein FQP81_17200 [Pseudoalteromonas elyakovii]